jgi:hypothetical protein
MNLTILLKKLIEIERSIGVETDAVIRRKVQDVQDDVLQMQKERASKLQKEHRHHAA